MQACEFLEFRIVPRHWGEECIVVQTDQYLGKFLRYKAGSAGGLQYHVEKDECFHLIEGLAWWDSDDGSGKLIRTQLKAGMTVRIPPGAPHRLEALTDCFGVEWSTPHFDDRVRCEKDYDVAVIGPDGLPTTR
jgi:mannose-6-phosphate isomerase-like protein (cupin superfamily)